MNEHTRPRTTVAVVLAAAVLLTGGCSSVQGSTATTTNPTTTVTSTAPSATPTDETDDPAAGAPETMTEGATTVQIQLTAGDVVLTATLAENLTADAFAAQLPMTVPISDHADTEKVFYPPSQLTTEGATDGYDPSAGDLAYYAPWGNVAVYYRDFSWSAGLVPMARLAGDPSVLADLADGTEVRIDLL